MYCKYKNKKSHYINVKKLFFFFHIFTAMKLLIFNNISFYEKLMM